MSSKIQKVENLIKYLVKSSSVTPWGKLQINGESPDIEISVLT